MVVVLLELTRSRSYRITKGTDISSHYLLFYEIHGRLLVYSMVYIFTFYILFNVNFMFIIRFYNFYDTRCQTDCDEVLRNYVLQ